MRCLVERAQDVGGDHYAHSELHNSALLKRIASITRGPSPFASPHSRNLPPPRPSEDPYFVGMQQVRKTSCEFLTNIPGRLSVDFCERNWENNLEKMNGEQRELRAQALLTFRCAAHFKDVAGGFNP